MTKSEKQKYVLKLMVITLNEATKSGTIDLSIGKFLPHRTDCLPVCNLTRC